MRTLSVGLVSLAMLIACDEKKLDVPPPAASSVAPASAPPPAPSASAAAAPAVDREAAQSTLKVLEAGAEPRRELRYKIQVGRAETLTLDMKMSMEMGAGSQKAPAVKIPTIRMLT